MVNNAIHTICIVIVLKYTYSSWSRSHNHQCVWYGMYSERIQFPKLYNLSFIPSKFKVISIPHAGRVAVLIATDVASRGLDIKDITYVTVSSCIPATHNSKWLPSIHLLEWIIKFCILSLCSYIQANGSSFS